MVATLGSRISVCRVSIHACMQQQRGRRQRVRIVASINWTNDDTTEHQKVKDWKSIGWISIAEWASSLSLDCLNLLLVLWGGSRELQFVLLLVNAFYVLLKVARLWKRLWCWKILLTSCFLLENYDSYFYLKTTIAGLIWFAWQSCWNWHDSVSYTHLRAHETR